MSWLQPVSTRDWTALQVDAYHANMQSHVDAIMGGSIISDTAPANTAVGTGMAAAGDWKFDSGVALGKSGMNWRPMHHASTMGGKPQSADNAILDGGSGMTLDEAEDIATRNKIPLRDKELCGFAYRAQDPEIVHKLDVPKLDTPKS